MFGTGVRRQVCNTDCTTSPVRRERSTTGRTVKELRKQHLHSHNNAGGLSLSLVVEPRSSSTATDGHRHRHSPNATSQPTSECDERMSNTHIATHKDNEDATPNISVHALFLG
jgi:hypothetical protein